MNYRNAQGEPIVFRQLLDVISQFPFLASSVFNFYVSKSELFMQDMSEPEPEAESEAETDSEGEAKSESATQTLACACGLRSRTESIGRPCDELSTTSAGRNLQRSRSCSTRRRRSSTEAKSALVDYVRKSLVDSYSTCRNLPRILLIRDVVEHRC